MPQRLGGFMWSCGPDDVMGGWAPTATPRSFCWDPSRSDRRTSFLLPLLVLNECENCCSMIKPQAL